MLVADIKINGTDSADARIIDVYKRNPPDYAIYRTEQRVVVCYADDRAVAKTQSALITPLNPVRGEINGLIDGWRAGNEKDQAKARRYDRRIADALGVAMENDAPGALAVLNTIKTDIVAERTSWSRFIYLLAALASSAIAILFVWGVLEAFVSRDNSPLWLLWFSLAGGTIGAFFSIAIAIRSRTVLTDLHMRDNVADAMLRVVIGAIAAGVLVTLLRLQVVSISLGSFKLDGTVGDAWLSALLLAFVAGFSERLVPDLLEKTASSVSTSTATMALPIVPAVMRPIGGAATALGPRPAIGSPANDPSTLQAIRNDLQAGRQVIGALKNLGVGSELVGKVDSIAGTADQVLSTIDGVLQGNPGAPSAAQVAGDATQVLSQLGQAGLPGILGGAASVLGTAAKIAVPALAGLPGGPVGIVAGLVMGGLQVLSDQRKFEAWKAALLAKPFDRSLLPTTVDGNTAQLALEFAPLMAKRLEGSPPNVATELLRACVTPAANAEPKSSSDLAQQMLADAADPLGLRARFASEAELAEALEEYRASAIFVRARDELAGQVAIPALAGAAETTVDLGTLLTGAMRMRQDPRAGDALEKIVFVVQALGGLHLDPSKLSSLVVSGLEAGAALVGTTRNMEDRRNVAA